MCSCNCASEIVLREHIEIKQKPNIVEQVSQPKFFCHECNASSKTKTSLKKHEKIHQVSRSEECQNCGQKFKHKTDLSNHISECQLNSSITSNKECENCKELDVCEGCLDRLIPRGNTNN